MAAPDEEQQWYEIVKHNFVRPDRTTDEVITIVRGRSSAERMAAVLTARLKPEEREEGFSVYARRTRHRR
jgi:hypothetical protein